MRNSTMKFIALSILFTFAGPGLSYINGQQILDPHLKIWFTFDNAPIDKNTIADESGNNFTTTLKNNATILKNGGIDKVHGLGSSDGYIDLGGQLGTGPLQNLDDFTISTFVYISAETDHSKNGNFV